MSTGNAVHWDIQVSEETDQALRDFFENQGIDTTKKSKFVEQAVLKHVFHQTVAEIHAQNRDLDPDQLQAAVDAAVRGSTTGKTSRIRISKGS